MASRALLRILLGTTLAASPAALAQDAESRGRAVLDAAIAAAGGRNALLGADRWVVAGRGRENLTAEWQGRAWREPTWRDHEELVAVAGGRVAWERKTPRNDFSLRWRRFIHGPDASGFIDWNAKRGRLAAPGTPASDRAALARRIPHVLLREAAAGPVEVRWTRQAVIDNRSCDVITVRLAGATLRLFVDQQSRRLDRVEYDAYLPGAGDSVVAWTWSGGTPDASIGWRPARQRVSVNGVPFQDLQFTRYEAGARDAGSLMDVPPTLTGGSMTMDAVLPAAGAANGEVAPGVHVQQIQGVNVLVVEGRDGLLAVEAPEAARGLEAIPAGNGGRAGHVAPDQAAWLDRRFPGRPLREIAITHHHSDHIGGLPLLAARGNLTVLTTSSDEAAARHVLGAPRTLAPWPAAPGVKPAVRVEAVRGRRVIDDGRRSIELLSTGDNPHTSDNLVVWLPAERILFQGDLFYFDDGAPFPPPGRETMNRFFADWLAGRGISPRAIYGVHNTAPAGADALARARR